MQPGDSHDMAERCSWYKVERHNLKLTIEFQQSPDRFWEPDKVLGENPVSGWADEVREVTLTGPGAVWMYAHAAAMCRAYGAKSIRVEKPDRTQGSSDLSNAVCEMRSIAAEKGLFWMKWPSFPRLTREAIETLLRDKLDALEQQPPQELVIAGRAGVEAYARVAERAVACGVSRIYCWSARDGLVLVYDRDGTRLGGPVGLPEWLHNLFPRPETPVVIGVAGDPNVGKSVFCNVLDWYMARQSEMSWLLDCDGQSPTSKWYLSLLDEEEARRLRQASKITWTAEMEALIASQLRRGREFFDVLLADLPGGIHEQGRSPIRIPEGRERILREVDAFVLLQRADRPTAEDWREALRPHQLDDRVIAIITSKDPSASLDLKFRQQDGLWYGEAYGLDRSILRQAPRPCPKSVVAVFDQVWRDWVRLAGAKAARRSP